MLVLIEPSFSAFETRPFLKPAQVKDVAKGSFQQLRTRALTGQGHTMAILHLPVTRLNV